MEYIFHVEPLFNSYETYIELVQLTLENYQNCDVDTIAIAAWTIINNVKTKKLRRKKSSLRFCYKLHISYRKNSVWIKLYDNDTSKELFSYRGTMSELKAKNVSEVIKTLDLTNSSSLVIPLD